MKIISKKKSEFRHNSKISMGANSSSLGKKLNLYGVTIDIYNNNLKNEFKMYLLILSYKTIKSSHIFLNESSG